MLPLLADENFDNRILNGLRRRLPELDLVRVQDVGLASEDDPTILEWAAQEGRVLLTHDVATITRYAYERLEDGKPMPGVVEVHARVPLGPAIDDLLLMISASLPGEWEGQIRYIPLR